MDTGLSPQIMNTITNILAAQPKVDEAVVFGSRAMGNYEPGSDLDIAVKGPALSHRDILRMLAQIDDVELLINIDLVHYDKISDPNVISHIDRKGKLLFQRADAR